MEKVTAFFNRLNVKMNNESKAYPQFKVGMNCRKVLEGVFHSLSHSTSIAEQNGIPALMVKLASHGEAQVMGSNFGRLGIYQNEAFLMHDFVREAEFLGVVKRAL
jgi:hypothetical protein